MSKASLEDRLHEIAKHINRGDLNTILDAIETVRLVEDYKARIDELEGREITENDAVKLLRRKGYTVTSPSDRAKAFDRLITGKK